MKTPTWAIVVGIFLLLFGGCDLLAGVSEISTPKMMEVQQNFLQNMPEMLQEQDAFAIDSIDVLRDSLPLLEEDSLEIDQSIVQTRQDSVNWDSMNEVFDDMFYLSPKEKLWIVRFGYMSILAGSLFILAALFMFIPRSFSIPLAVGVLVFSALKSIGKMIVLTGEEVGSVFSIMSNLGEIPSIILDVIILAVILVSRKDHFNADRHLLDDELVLD